MTSIPGESGVQIAELEQLRLVQMQEGVLSHFRPVRTMLRQLLASFAAARDLALQEANEVFVQPDRLQALIGKFEDALMIEVADGERESLRTAAANRGRLLCQKWDDELGKLHHIAMADLQLRVLTVLVLEALGKPYTGECRLPEWDQYMETAHAELEAASEAWRHSREAV